MSLFTKLLESFWEIPPDLPFRIFILAVMLFCMLLLLQLLAQLALDKRLGTPGEAVGRVYRKRLIWRRISPKWRVTVRIDGYLCTTGVTEKCYNSIEIGDTVHMDCIYGRFFKGVAYITAIRGCA